MTAAVFVMDDNATWLARRPQDLDPTVLAEVIELTRAERFVEAWRKMRIKIADERVTTPLKPPYNLTANQWSLHAEGTTYFLPVGSYTYAAINFIDEGFYDKYYRPETLSDTHRQHMEKWHGAEDGGTVATGAKEEEHDNT